MAGAEGLTTEFEALGFGMEGETVFVALLTAGARLMTTGVELMAGAEGLTTEFEALGFESVGTRLAVGELVPVRTFVVEGLAAGRDIGFAVVEREIDTGVRPDPEDADLTAVVRVTLVEAGFADAKLKRTIFLASALSALPETSASTRTITVSHATRSEDSIAASFLDSLFS